MRSPSEREKLHREAERRWARLGRDHPELAATIAAGRGLVALYIDHLPPAPPLALEADAAREKLAAGVPLLADESLDFDLPALRAFFAALCAWAAAQPERAADGERLARAVGSGETVADDLLAATLAGDDVALGTLAQRLGVADDWLRSLVGFLASAALMGVAHALGPLLAREGAAWGEAHCPVCEGLPLLAEHQGSEGQRVLRCATCGAGWRFPRNRCAHCGTDEPGAQHYLAAEGTEEKYRVDLCDRCHRYLKSVTAFAPTPAELLAIDDTAMLHLEAAARERGYLPLSHEA
jgi:FdhE protein